MDSLLVAREYATHLSDADLRLLIEAAGAKRAGQAISRLRQDPSGLPGMIADPRTFTAVLGDVEPGAGGFTASPFLVFAVAVHQAAGELASAGHVPERTGPRQRVPLFDAPALREFLAEPARRLFLAELLASFTKVSSGRYRVQAGGRVRTRRFSELDPARLAGLLDAVPPPSAPACTAGWATWPCSWPGCSPITRCPMRSGR